MIIQIQETSALIFLISLLWIYFDNRNIDDIPYWQAFVVVSMFFLGFATLIITAFIRIWS